MAAPADSGQKAAPGLWRRAMRILRPSHEHSAFSATVLLMAAVMLSRVIGYVREAYIAYAFGAGAQTDAYVAAFTLPDWLNYLVAGGTVSITFITIFSRYIAEGREAEAHKAFSVIVTLMSLVLIGGIVLAQIFTPQIERVIFPEFTAQQLELCVYLTRVLLPAQLFFYVGGVVAAVLMSRRLFLFPALAPLFYNVFIILGGVLLGGRVGVASLAYGAVAGAVLGPFLANLLGAVRIGLRYRPSLDISHPGFREWVRLTIPLMLGVTLVAADEWIERFFASGSRGDITRLNYAKRLMAVPIAVMGQAVGQASLPFFARLIAENKIEEFARTVSGAVFRAAAVALVASAWMAAAALPIIDLVYRRGQFTVADSERTAIFFFWFSLALAFWTSQALYARAFYAAGDTFTPMVAGTVIVLVALAVYAALFRTFGVVGLAMASGVGIAAHTITVAALLHRRGLVPAGALPWMELLKALATAVFAAGVSFSVARLVPLDGSRRADLLSLALISLTWAGAVAAGLWITRSELPKAMRRGGSGNNSAGIAVS